MSHKEILQSFGLTENEIAVYFAVLEMGMAPASIIAKKSGLKRPTTYEILKKLTTKNIAEVFLRKNIKYYGVISPQVLFERYEKFLGNFQSALPQMMAVSNNIVNKPKVSFYEGKEELEKLYYDVIRGNATKEALNYFHPGEAFEYFSHEFVEQHVAERVQKGIGLRIILQDSKWTDYYKKIAEKTLRNIRVSTDTRFLFKNEVYIYDNKISIFSFDDHIGLMIESADVYDTQKAMFELAWESRLLEK